MATLLLSRPEKTTRGQDLRRTLLHLLHGFQAVENALTIFALPFSSHAELLAIAGHPEILAQFDAHVGDTACHMRAQMIWELYEYYKLAERREWVIIALEALARVKFQTVALMLALHKKNGYMRALGFGSVISFGQLFDKVGWTGFLDNFDQKRKSGSEDSDSCYSESPILATPPDLGPIDLFDKFDASMVPPDEEQLPFEPLSSRRSSSLARSDSFSSFSSHHSNFSSPLIANIFFSSGRSTDDPSPLLYSPLASTPCGSSHSYRNITTDCTWDVTNHLTVIRFLTMCRLLSAGKRAKVQAGFPNAAIRARTDPEFIYEQTEMDIEAYYNSFGYEVEWKKLICSDDRVKKTFLIREEEAVQVWLSSLTADWMAGLSKEVGFSNSMQSFLKSSIITSSRQIACVASHASIIPIRAEWMLRGTPILLVIRRFCSQGYHSSFYRVTPNASAWESISLITNLRAVDVGKNSWFHIEPVSSSQVRTSSWSTTPHFILISNSIDGTTGEFYDRVAEDGYDDASSPWPHNDSTCAEHEAYLPKVLESNFSRIVMGFFGQHDQYPFDLPYSQPVTIADDQFEFFEDGHEYIARKMEDHGFSREAMENYRRACQEVEESGTGERPWLYTFEHAYTELPFVVGRQVEDIMERGIKPVPIGYRWWN